MAAATHHVGRAEHDGVAGLGRGARGFLADGEFGDIDAEVAKGLAHFGTVVVMREHPHLCSARRLGQPRDRGGDLVGTGDDTLHQAIERLAGKAGALDHAAALLRLCQVRHRRIHVVVECEQIDAPVGQPSADLGLGVEIVGLVAQVEAGVGGELWPHGLDRFEQQPCVIGAAKARLP